MRLSILDTNYSSPSHLGMGATWLNWELSKAGIQTVPLNTADIVLATVSSQQGLPQLKSGLKRYGVQGNAKLIVGGGGAYAPAIFDELASACCVGEGTRFVRTLMSEGVGSAMELPESWVPGEKRAVTPYDQFPWDIPPIRHPDGTIRLFASRGCRRKCLFCQTGWESTYRESPSLPALRGYAKSINSQSERVVVVTNDGAEMSLDCFHHLDFISATLANLKRLLLVNPITRQHTKSVRIGVEGVSERLRRAVAKPIPNGDLLDVTSHLLSEGVGVRWFFIVGLPGETIDDYEDLRAAIYALKKVPKGCVMMNFHAFIPQPAAPLSVLPLEDGYWERFEEFRRWFFHGPGFTRRVQIIPPSKEPGRLKRAKLSMAADESDLRSGWFNKTNSNWRIHYPCEYTRLRDIARIYARRVGIKCPSK